MPSVLSPAQIAAYHREGYLVVRQFFSQQEIKRLYDVAVADTAISHNSYDLSDQTGKRTKLALWFTPGEDIYGLLTRSARMVHATDQLLDGTTPVCHFHSKLMQKEPRVGGAWEWHQDYGYWYKNEFLLPDQMLSVMVAITPATQANGCLQVIKGSHRLGRVEHSTAGEQVGAAPRYVELALATMELVHVELNPGDTLFFHSNLLHRSAANASESSRWSLISAYNRQSNVPYNERSTACITPLRVVPDEALLQAEASGLAAGADFLRKEADVSLR